MGHKRVTGKDYFRILQETMGDMQGHTVDCYAMTYSVIAYQTYTCEVPTPDF